MCLYFAFCLRSDSYGRCFRWVFIITTKGFTMLHCKKGKQSIWFMICWRLIADRHFPSKLWYFCILNIFFFLSLFTLFSPYEPYLFTSALGLEQNRQRKIMKKMWNWKKAMCFWWGLLDQVEIKFLFLYFQSVTCANL